MRATKARRLLSLVLGVTPLLISIPAAALDFWIQDVETGYALAKDGATFGAVSGQNLRFLPSDAAPPLSWSFGDGTTSSENQPFHTYTTRFDASVVVTLTSGADSKSVTLRVAGSDGAPLTAGFRYLYADGGDVTSSRVAWNRTIRFTASDAATAYVWDFGDGSSATGSPVDHAFTKPGTFDVRLTASRGTSSVTTPSPARLTVLAPPDRPLWVVPGIAYTDGFGGAFWQSDVTIVNPAEKNALVLSLAFLDGRAPVDPSALRWIPLTLAPLESVTFTNILAQPPFSLARGAFGALLVRDETAGASTSEPTVTARTYSGSGGTYGLSGSATSTSRGVRVDAGSGENLLPGLRETATHYTNLALVNLQADAARAEIRFFSPRGDEIGTPVKVDVPAFGLTQLTHVLSAAPPNGAGVTAALDGFTASVTLLSGTAVAPYATVIDTRSKDPILVTPPARVSSSARLPGIVRASGRNGTLWRSDVVITNPSTSPRRVSLSFSYQAGTGGRDAIMKRVSLAPRESLTVVDFVAQVLGLQGGDGTNVVNGVVDVSRAADDPVDEPILVSGRTYNDQPSGEVGLGIPAFTDAQGAFPKGTNRRLVVAGLKSNAAYRSNLAVFLLPASDGGDDALADVSLFDRAGKLLRTRRLTLDAISSVAQWNDADLFDGLGASSEDVTAVIEAVSGAPIGAFATVIDQVSGDASFVAGQPQQ